MGNASNCRKRIKTSKSGQDYFERCRFNNKFLKGCKNLNRHLAFNFKPRKVFLCYQNKSDEFWQAQQQDRHSKRSFVFRGRFPVPLLPNQPPTSPASGGRHSPDLKGFSRPCLLKRGYALTQIWLPFLPVPVKRRLRQSIEWSRWRLGGVTNTKIVC